jgi:RNA polymerase sigma-70 factor (ECF subfamily)
MRRRVAAELQALPERQRTALALCHYQGLPQAEAAAVMDVSVEALESLLARARRTLRDRLRAVADDVLERAR